MLLPSQPRENPSGPTPACWTRFRKGSPVKRSVTVSQDAGWGRFNSQRLVWVVRNGSDVTVCSATSPHLGCTINKTSSGFICPCHGSAWNAGGQRLGGPTARSMDVLEYRIDGDLLKVKYQYFKEGVAGKEPVIGLKGPMPDSFPGATAEEKKTIVDWLSRLRQE